MNSRLLSAGCVCWLIVSHASFGTEEPRLSIATSGDEIVVSWPIAASNWVLEASSALAPAVVSVADVPPPYETNGPWRQVRVAPPTTKSGNRFYRLRRQVPPVEGLTGHWQLDEGTGEASRDDTGGGATFFTTGTSWGVGKLGAGSLQFLGGAISRAWVSNENSRVLPTAGGPFSLSLWFNPDAVLPGLSALAGNDATGTSGWRVALNTPATGTNFFIFSSGGPATSLSVTGRVLLLPGQWHQLTVTYDGAQGSIYLDSEMLGRASGQISPQTGPIYLGGGVAGLASFLGRIDDVRTYTNCLTHEQISLTGHWRFDENFGNFAADSSVQGHHATVTEATAWVPARNGTGIDLSCGQVVVENREDVVLPPTGGPFSVSMWIRPGELQNGIYGLMHCSSPAGTSGWQLALDANASSGKQLHWVSTNFGGTLDLRAPTTMTSGVWTKLDLTFNGGIATLYADGHKVASGSGAIRASQAPLVVGAVPGTLNFNGVVDDLKVYSRERGEGEVGPYAPVMWETVLRNTSTNITIAGSGPAGKTLTYSIVPLITPTNGTVTIASGAASFTYTAGARKGPDAFTYTVSDGEFTTAPTVVTISVVEPHWLSVSGGGEPRDASSPERAWPAGTADAVDAVWRTNNYYDCFFYAPGIYETRGWKLLERSTANAGCKHIGSGSSGSAPTTIRLVDIWSAWGEETIFAASYAGKTTDNFEIHNMVLDCNATNVPKYAKGEPVWIRIPLAAPARVESITLHWGQGSVLGNANALLSIGPALEFSVDALTLSTDGYITNHLTATRTGQVDTVMIGTEVDELVVRLERRAPGVDMYGLAEVELTGATVSLPAAKVTGGPISQLDAQHDFLQATDGDRSTWWASGPESEVQLDLPLAPGAIVSDLRFNWNCRNIAGTGQAGPAAGYFIQAHDELSGQWFTVPLTRQFRNAAGEETAAFGTDQSPTNIVTDHLVIVLTNRETGVDFYSLREVTPHYAGRAVALRQPSAMNYLAWAGQFPVRQAFDRNPGTVWASGTQGMVGAVNVSGSNLKFTRLKVIGFGTPGMRECFPMFISPGFQAERPQLGNVTVDDCVFTDPAPVNKDGVTVLLVAGNAFVPMTNAVVRRCSFSGLRSHFATTQATTATHVENCTISDCAVGVYFEPERGIQEIIGPVLIRSNSFYNVDSGLFMAMHPGTRFGQIAMLDNEIVLEPRLGWGLAVCDACDAGPPGTVTNVTALNNLVRYRDWTLRPLNNEGGLAYTDIQHAVFGNNTILLGGSKDLGIRPCPTGFVQTPGIPEDCDHPVAIPPGPPAPVTCLETLVPGYRRAWFNNRNWSGGLSEIRIYKDGVVRPAEPQQWPD